MNDELKPCPFCGSASITVLPYPIVSRKFVKCETCETSWILVTIWQQRPIEDALRSELAQARADAVAAREERVTPNLDAQLEAMREIKSKLEADKSLVQIIESQQADLAAARAQLDKANEVIRRGMIVLTEAHHKIDELKGLLKSYQNEAKE